MRSDLGLVAGFAAVVFGVALATTRADAAGKNLKHFPKDISSEDLQASMKLIKNSLGVQCGYCHVVVPKKEFDKDTPKKKAALYMLDMVDKINKELFTWQDAPKATCYMCHRGEEKTELKPESSDKENKFKAECQDPKNADVVKSMKAMVEKLNKSYFTWKDAPKATCWMCHRGEKEPKTKLPE
jgi:hypothetical protein